MGIWRTIPVTEQPSVHLERWSIREVEDEAGVKSRHFIGWLVENTEGRASSAIQTFDKEAQRGVTASGRVYQLIGEPDTDRDAGYVWDYWKLANGIVKDTEVSFEEVN